MRNQCFHLLFFVVIGCSGTDSNTESKKPTFEGFVSEIPVAQLPYFDDCNTPMSFFDISYKVYEEFLPVGAHPYLKLQSNSKYTLIIFGLSGDITWPYLYSYSEKGKIVDSVGLFIGSCQSDPLSESRSYARIGEDLLIELSDSLKHFSFDGTNQIYDSTTVENRIYNLTSDGKFELALDF